MINNLRADDGQNECAPWEVAGAVLGIHRVSLGNRIGVLAVRSRGAVGVAVLRAYGATRRAGEYRDSDEGADECKVKQDPEPSKPLGTASLDDALDKRSEKGVENGGRKNALNGTEGARDAALGLD